MRERRRERDNCRLLYQADNVGFNSHALSSSPLRTDLRDRPGSVAVWNKWNSSLSPVPLSNAERSGSSQPRHSRTRPSLCAAAERRCCEKDGTLVLFVSVSSQQWSESSAMAPGITLMWSLPTNESCRLRVGSAVSFQTPGRIVMNSEGAACGGCICVICVREY